MYERIKLTPTNIANNEVAKIKRNADLHWKQVFLECNSDALEVFPYMRLYDLLFFILELMKEIDLARIQFTLYKSSDIPFFNCFQSKL